MSSLYVNVNQGSKILHLTSQCVVQSTPELRDGVVQG